MELIATTTFGLEAVAARELKELGYSPEILGNGRVLFAGDAADVARTNVWLRTADRVLIRLGQAPATDFEQLYQAALALPWERWIDPEAALPVRGRSVKSQLSSVPACQRTVKKALVERLMASYDCRALPETGPAVSIEVALLNDRASFTLDTTGRGLTKRGYRPLVGRAPLRETLAAGMVLLSYYQPGRAMVDPFCGTGTIAIEAAMIARNLAPGRNRDFQAEAWPSLAGPHWQQARDEAAAAAAGPLDERIVATDIDEQALSLARHHAEQAGVGEDIHFQQRDFRDLSSPRDHGVLVTNPPYGQRLGDRREAVEIYKAMPEVFRRLRSWSFYVLCPEESFEQILGRSADKRRKLYNGRIRCTFYQFHGPPPGTDAQDRARRYTPGKAEKTAGPEAGRSARPAFGGIDEKARQQAQIFANRLAKRAKHLRRWPKQGVSCYRLYDRDIPEVPLAVDLYEGRLHISEYARPNEHTPAEHGDWLELLAATAAEALEVDPRDVHLKTRQRQKGNQQYQRVGEGGEGIVVQEGGLKFEVNLQDYLDTGLFLDHRITRRMVRDEAAGKRFLNLFCYTGSFTVYAADGGAAGTVSVDSTRAYLDWAKRNLELNGFDAGGSKHRMIRTDAMAYLAEHPPGAHFDLAVVDPPTFSNSKSLEGDWDVQRDHAELLGRLGKLMPDGGVVYFSTNFRRFKLDEPALPGWSVREISRQTVPEDFRNQRIHRCWRMVKEAPTQELRGL